MSSIPYDPKDDRDRFHLLTGRVIRAWADLEGSMWHFASLLLGVDQFRARIVMGSISNGRAQRELVARLAETYLDDALLPKFRGYLKRMKTLGDQRNTLAHSMIHINTEGTRNLAFRDHFNTPSTPGFAFQTEPFPLNQVKVLETAIHRLKNEMTAFIFEVDGRVHTSAKIHREQEDDPTK